MNEQTRTASAAAAGDAMSGERAAKGAQPEDAWDRLAALAFGGATSASGCSVHAHDYDCSCSPELERQVYSDPEFEIVD